MVTSVDTLNKPIEAPKLLYTQQDICLGLSNAALLSTELLARSSIVPSYLQTTVEAANFIARLFQYLHSYEVIPKSARNERFLAHPIVHTVTSFYSPLLHGISAFAKTVGVADNCFTKIFDYMQSPTKSNEQSAIAGTALHALNLGTQAYLTYEPVIGAFNSILDWESYFRTFLPGEAGANKPGAQGGQKSRPSTSPASNFARSLGVDVDPNCEQAKGASRTKACAATCKKVKKAYYKEALTLHPDKNPGDGAKMMELNINKDKFDKTYHC